ncbi:DUF4422 domain-containing protein [Bacillus hwajinpoensis]|uniref:DUF4422 domain-containing protein n=1 Tax=Guptibacillus hwajinpoensis TaxID=208199 RepID=A0A845ERB5_9BACL|nr:DUF4422 domain-containing protein [Pseudalkalibacillus hwajinpoensis]MYL62249.1 DUF4422 domain-containing protein [Pseudalkalibacillus hwajinpoensis]
MSDIKILVATHKKYEMPEESMYLPIHVGREGKEDLGYIGDNTGDNISKKNKTFCELTGLYWAWKNLDCNYVGLSHYRRYFLDHFHNKKESESSKAMSQATVKSLLESNDVIVPKKRDYYIESVRSHYANAHNISDLEKTREIISELSPEYLSSFDKVMNSRQLHLYNMFIMDKKNFDSYATWLFDILFRLENEIDVSSYDSYQKRVFGFISERLFNVWLEESNLNIKTVPVFNCEKINWSKKITSFLIRKVK